MNELRSVTIRLHYNNETINGYFHRWFEKSVDDENMLFAVVENEIDGKIVLYDYISCDITFNN